MKVVILFVLSSAVMLGACIYSSEEQQKKAMKVWRVVSEIK